MVAAIVGEFIAQPRPLRIANTFGRIASGVFVCCMDAQASKAAQVGDSKDKFARHAVIEFGGRH